MKRSASLCWRLIKHAEAALAMAQAEAALPMAPLAQVGAAMRQDHLSDEDLARHE